LARRAAGGKRSGEAGLGRELEQRADLAGRTVGELVNGAIGGYLRGAGQFPKCGSLRDPVPEPYPEGCERLSEEIDAVVYGA
jgi:hypothetical protein